MWPKRIVMVFGFRDKEFSNVPIKVETQEAELRRFSQMRAEMLGNEYLNKEMWSHIVVTPGGAKELMKALPDSSPSGMPVRAPMEAAYEHDDTHWVERAEMCKLAELYSGGGIAKDCLDCRLTHPEHLEKCRQWCPLLVTGNALSKSGGFYESDTIAVPMRFPPLLDLIATVAGRITSRKARKRVNGPH
tara:strand:- start:56 stop:622 length:567 start_codon:yes stop_codon:yes gene_type:complete